MAFPVSTAKVSEMPLCNSLPLRSSYSYSSLNRFFSSQTLSFSLLRPFFSSSSSSSFSNSSSSTNARITQQKGGRSSNLLRNPRKRNSEPASKSRSPSAPWLNKWAAVENEDQRVFDSQKKQDRVEEDRAETRYFDGDKGRSAIERIVFRLRNLGIGSEEEEEEEGEEDAVDDHDNGGRGNSGLNCTGEEKLGDLLQRKWSRPDSVILDYDDDGDRMVLPWEREENEREEEEDRRGLRKKRVKAPSLAELTLEDAELRRLRTLGMTLRERINIPKAGVTQVILEKIHDKWRKAELVRLKFHETLAHDMKKAHQIVERRTGGLVIWKSGSVMVVYRGSNYERPSLRTQSVDMPVDGPFVPDMSSANDLAVEDERSASSTSEKIQPTIKNLTPMGNMTEEEVEFNSLLDGLGPRFVDWWGTGLLPVDADLLPPFVPGYKTPFRLLPTGMRSHLTNAEMTNLRKLSKSLPCHFALGRNRNHQGLASAIVKLWEKSLVVKIAVKRGIQNTNNKLMSEEIKKLTGGTLLLRNKYYIIIYRGKDFLPTSVAAALTERQELTKKIQDVEEEVRSGAVGIATGEEFEGEAAAGTLAEFLEAQARWGRDISAEEYQNMQEEVSRARNARIARKIERKLEIAQAKKLRAEKLLAKIEASMVPVGPSDDQETITDEERFMFRRVGLRMKAYLPLGIRGVFDGVIENMHLHWKHRELVKLISKQKTLSFVEDTARLLEYESGGILVAIERVPKGYALIYYRGKNYQRPISIRPRNLLTKAKALKRSVAMQRHEALSQHISELERTIEGMKSEIVDSKYEEVGNNCFSEEGTQFDYDSEYTQSEDDQCSESNSDDDNDDDWEGE